MSLPSTLHLTLDRKSVYKCFCNVGWFSDDRAIAGCILRAMEYVEEFSPMDLGEDLFDSFYLYGT